MNQQIILKLRVAIMIFMVNVIALMQFNRLEAQDWMQFLANSEASENANLPTKWDESTNITWKTKLPGPGASSPIIVGKRVFLTCYSGYGDKSEGKIEDLQRHLLCFDRANGEIVWQKAFDNSSVQDEDPYKSFITCLLYTSPSPRDQRGSRMPSSA